MANKLLTALFGDYSTKELKRIRKTVDSVMDLVSNYEPMSDNDLA